VPADQLAPVGGPEPGDTFGGLAAYVRKLPPRLGDVRLVAVDGPSGAGKTRFALGLAKALGAPVVHTDDLLDGWDDQFTFWERLESQVLGPLRRGETACYRRYRWDRGAFDPAPVRLDPAPVVIVEGVSAARRVIRPELSLAVWPGRWLGTGTTVLRSGRTLSAGGSPRTGTSPWTRRPSTPT
jgi:hypothetical protein